MLDQLIALSTQLAAAEAGALALAQSSADNYTALLKAGTTEVNRLAAHPAPFMSLVENIQRAQKRNAALIKKLTGGTGDPPVPVGNLPTAPAPAVVPAAGKLPAATGESPMPPTSTNTPAATP